MKKSTSWGGVAKWYDAYVEREGTYQKELILPNLVRLLNIQKGEVVLDLACGQGFFSREFFSLGAKVIGVDVSKELISFAKAHSSSGVRYEVSPARRLSFLPKESVHKIVCVLAIQNIENVGEVLQECARVLRGGGKIYFVMMHPGFRIPHESSWSFDEEKKIQYRRIDSYLSESKEKIQMHPGDKPSEYTFTFHRPLQFYFKGLVKAGFFVSGLEEWNSHKKSELGPRQKAEDKARKEIPLFLFLEGTKK